MFQLRLAHHHEPGPGGQVGHVTFPELLRFLRLQPATHEVGGMFLALLASRSVVEARAAADAADGALAHLLLHAMAADRDAPIDPLGTHARLAVAVLRVTLHLADVFGDHHLGFANG